jgi:hypothetical protein
VKRWTLIAAAFTLAAAALWHLPATAQHTVAASAAETAVPQSNAVASAPRPVAAQLITFDEYRDFRLRDIAERRERLAHALANPELSAAQKANLEARKGYYDRLAAMPATARDQLFRARFDEIDTDHDGLIDEAERAAWREKQREHYRELAASRATPTPRH